MLGALLLMATVLPQDPLAGVTLELARARRAQVGAVSYDLQFELAGGATDVRGSVAIRFELRTEGDVVLDSSVQDLADLRLNGEPAGDHVRQVHDHLLLDRRALRAGENLFEASFRSPTAATGTPLTTFRDPVDGASYCYTLVVPADAHGLFPCFDQPDLKGTFRLALTLPESWSTAANSAETDVQPAGEGRVTRRFAPTRPLPTYLFAFAAGPFDVLPVADAAVPMRILLRKSRRAQLEPELLAGMHARALAWLEDYFGIDYPFGKLDCVLCPGFPYGGMEHAGAIFYRESALVFDHPPTVGEQVRRSTLIYHEVAHQWFGNLVTMQWFDDLWLKEGFATFVGYKLLEVLEPERQAWLRFLQRIKPAAYRVDATAGTTPIWQALQSLADAKSAYGAIVYNKAPAVLRELEQRLGADTFRDGVRRFLRRHAFANARWEDLVAALEEAQSAPGASALWSERWILAPGMPRVQVELQSEGGRVTGAVLRQRGVQDEARTWPLRVALLVLLPDSTRRELVVTSSEAATPIPELEGLPVPLAILPNPDDVAYAQCLLDPRSFDWLADHLDRLGSPLAQMAALGAMWETVREAQAPPKQMAATLLARLAIERDAETRDWLLDTLGTIAGRYVEPDVREQLLGEASELLLAQLRDGIPGLELDTFRFLAVHGRGEDVTALLRACADGKPPPGLVLGLRDRFLALASLLAAGTDEGRFAASADWKEQDDPDFAKHRYVAQAARAEPTAKQQMWESYLDPTGTPEQWIQESLSFFHWPGQAKLTLPFLRPALERVEWVKQHRRIFFMPAWLDGFINGHSSAEALAVVREFLAARPELPDDIRRKLLQSLDGLERAVRIRARWQ